MAIPRRKNSDTIDASWFNGLADAIEQAEGLEPFEILDGAAAAALDGYSFDGDEVSSVVIDYEAQRTGVFSNGHVILQNVAGTWRKIESEFDGEDCEILWDIDQVGTVVTLEAGASNNPSLGDLTLKLKRRTFDAV